MTTYQRLKAENLELKRQLRILALEPDSADAATIRKVVKFNVQAEKAIWAGWLEDIDKPETMKGIMALINKETN